MIGPTGVGKTEIARRLARLAQRALHQGRGDQVHRGRLCRQGMSTPSSATWPTSPSSSSAGRGRRLRVRAEDAAEERILDALMPPPRSEGFGFGQEEKARPTAQRARCSARSCARASSTTRRSSSNSRLPARSWKSTPAGMEEMAEQLRGMFSQMGAGKQPAQAENCRGARLLVEEEAAKLVNEDEIKQQALPTPSRTVSSSSTRSTRSPVAATAPAPARSPPGRAARPAAAGRGHDGLDQSTGRSRPTISCSSPAAPSTQQSRAT